MLTGLPWRTAWKYRDRGYRHLFWDSGASLANLLALAEAAALPARVLLGFVDREVALLLDLREREELPLATTRSSRGPTPRATWPTARRSRRGGPRRPPWAPGARPRWFQRALDPRGGARSVAARRVPCDFAPSGGSLLAHLLSVHEVDGVPPGAYRWEGAGLEPVRSGGSRERSADLCLGQDLGGDSAYTAFHSCHLAPTLAALGTRGYRAAQLEAGIASGRLQLAARALGLGGSGLTFFDDEVSRLFATDAAPMTASAVGVPAHRSQPGRRPRDLPRLRVEDGPR